MGENMAPATGTLGIALKHAMALLKDKKLALAQQQAEAILKQVPAEINALYILSVALRLQGKPQNALITAEQLVNLTPEKAESHQELAMSLRALDRHPEALAAARAALALNNKLSACWKLVAQLLTRNGDEEGASEARRQFIKASSHHPDLIKATDLVFEGRLAVAERLLRSYLKQSPLDINAMRLLAEVGMKLGVFRDAEVLLERCLKLAPDFELARFDYALVLQKRQKNSQALDQLAILLEIEPDNPAYLTRKATTYVHTGQYDIACEIFESVLKRYPNNGQLYVTYGHALKTIGKQQQGIEAYRKAISLGAMVGEAYWSLANLKTVQFSDQDVVAMRQFESRKSCSRKDKFHLCFALGKALEDARDYDQAFHYYQKGNEIKAREVRYSADENKEITQKIISVCNKSLFHDRRSGCSSPSPIFILGLPRSGSTLLEQILSSHSLVDGTKELPDIIAIAQRLSRKQKRTDEGQYPAVLETLSSSELKALGEEYLERVKIQRGDAPYLSIKCPTISLI